MEYVFLLNYCKCFALSTPRCSRSRTNEHVDGTTYEYDAQMRNVMLCLCCAGKVTITQYCVRPEETRPAYNVQKRVSRASEDHPHGTSQANLYCISVWSLPPGGFCRHCRRRCPDADDSLNVQATSDQVQVRSVRRFHVQNMHSERTL